MKIIFRVDASLKIGTGHVMRCLTLAKILKENGSNVRFICRKHDGNLIDKIRSSRFKVQELEVLKGVESNNKLTHSHWLGATQQQDADDCINILKAYKVDWLIVDHYALDGQWQKALKPYCKKIMVIDDLADRKHCCDILLDQTFARQQEDYSRLTSEGCKLLLGSHYALLRPEFSKWREYSLERRRKLRFKQLFINMGGVDVDNITGQVIDELKICNLPNDIKIIVVMGGSAPHLEDIRSKVSMSPFKVELKIDVDNMAEIMSNSDIAIGASGATTWERCCLGLPTIQIIVAENQNTIAKSLERIAAIRIFKDAKELPGRLHNATSWMKSVSDNAKKISDGLGLARVMKVIIDGKL
jgi:UDP-2,4-diacetamido-2,4,6-trideoxy-beta-L-altropyranose hydrolase